MNLASIKHRLILALVITSFISISILSSYSIFMAIQESNNDLKEYRTMLIEQFDRSIKLEVETAHSLVQDIYNQQQKGVFPEAEAKKRAADLVRNLRFDNGNYFWIDTTEGINVVLLGRANVEGKSRLDLTDAKGKKIVRDFIEKAAQPEAGGYTDYAFPKPNETQELPKRSYVQLFKPYNWIIGTGNWIDNIDKLVDVKAKENQKKLYASITIILVIAFLGLIFSALIAWYIGKKIAVPIESLSGSVKEVAAGNLKLKDLSINSQDEIGVLAKSFNSMKAHLAQLIKEVSNTAGQVADASEELTATSEQTALATTQVATSIVEVRGL